MMYCSHDRFKFVDDDESSFSWRIKSEIESEPESELESEPDSEIESEPNSEQESKIEYSS